MKQFLQRWFKYLLFAGFFSLFINLLYLTFPIYMMAIYDRVLSSYSVPTLITITIGAITALIVLGGLDLLRSRLLIKVGVDMDQALSRPVLAEMVRDKVRIEPQGHSQGLADVNTLRNYFAGNAIFSLFDLPWVPIYLLIIFLIHPLLGMTATAGAVALLILGLLQEFLTRKRYQMAQAVSGQGRELANAGLRNAEVVSSMGMLTDLSQHWQRYNDENLRLQTKANRLGGALQSTTKSLRLCMQVIIFGVGAWLVIENQASAGVIIASSIIMGRALAPIEQGMATWKETVRARGAYRRLDNLLQTRYRQEIMELPEPEGRLEVQEAALVIGGNYILRNISFALKPGELMGLIGPSGAGKTSLCRLLLGLWPSAGTGKVELDGMDIYDRDKQELGAYIGYLPQDVELFSGTVCENIARLGEVDSEKVVQAAQLAGAHEIILRLPNGYDTDIGEYGSSLSGGQRQRIGLARALYGSPRLVVMDEPNSNLDDAGEKALLQALEQLKQQGITTVIVTHKPALLAGTDKILMLKEGQTSMFGPREEVFKQLTGGGPKQQAQAEPQT